LDNNDYVNGLGFCCNPSEGTTSGGSSTGKMTAKNDNAELQQFYYHPDHLGSSSYISNLDGEVVQHVEYVPFGEVFLEEKNAKWNTPYLFNGKELDKETGLYYYGARYYDAKTSIWASVDPLAVYNPVMETEFYYDGDHNGGAFNNKNLNTYGYCYQNPVALIDPNGKQIYFMTPPTERISATQASMSIDFIPVVGDAKGIIEAIIGYDFVGNKLSGNDRFLSILLMSELKDAKNTIEVIKDVRKVEKATINITVEESNKIDRKLLNSPKKPGNAPTFKKDGTSVEIHHDGQKAEGPFIEMHKNDHRVGESYAKNHPSGQKPLTKEERVKFESARKKYWIQQYPKKD